ncbi:hypothetical protein NHN26_06385 [Rhodovulum tesquicola]|uniref:hypothetical protein n=1 Tax=Rhodovulum tesquicola TaxID=540254 RepID=UPI002097DF1F|nr:hypothetical protein [Rhodovulum tesquicola]MCO8144851.1 hypothetical protein [Rhodovulum tesquicola]
MDDDLANELTEAIKRQNELLEQANDLMPSLIDALRATAQELSDLRRQMQDGN